MADNYIGQRQTITWAKCRQLHGPKADNFWPKAGNYMGQRQTITWAKGRQLHSLLPWSHQPFKWYKPILTPVHSALNIPSWSMWMYIHRTCLCPLHPQHPFLIHVDIYSQNLPLSTPPSTTLSDSCGYIHRTCLCPLHPQHLFLIHVDIFTQPASVHSTLNIPFWFMRVYSHNLPLSTPPSTTLSDPCGYIHTTCLCPFHPQHLFLIHVDIFTQPASVHSTLNIPSWFMQVYSHNLPLSTPPSTSLPNPCGYIHTTCLCPLHPQHPFLIHVDIFTQPASVHSPFNIPS